MPDTLEFLHEIGVDMTEVDQKNFEMGLLHYIIKKEALEYWSERTKELLKFGIDVNVREQRMGSSALHLLVQRYE